MPARALDRSAAIDWYLRNRARSRGIFDLIEPSAYYARPIALRNPIVFYEGHLPAFSIISVLRRGLQAPPVDPRMEKLFERGIDPDSTETAVPRSGRDTAWPTRDEVLDFAGRADAAIVAALEREDCSSSACTQALYTALEHEAMHQETLLYMWHRLPYDQKRKPSGLSYELDLPPEGGSYGEKARGSYEDKARGSYEEKPGGSDEERAGGTTGGRVRIPAGVATLGAARERVTFGWDNEFDEHRVDVAPFDIDVHSVTNGDFLGFIRDGGYRTESLWSADGWEWVQHERIAMPAFWVTRGEAYFWRGMFEDIALPRAWPVYVSQAEAAAYARWKGRRLPTEAEFHRAAFGTPSGEERVYPWGDAAPDRTRGNFGFETWEPVPAGARPAGASAWGVHDLVGNGWEWTSTIFGPFAGFAPMASYPEYSADFFDGQHYVIKGASPATAHDLLRRSFRNWFRPNYPYVYAKFRTAR
jgi:formylglycine-generating enzyme required for sulfatase activity